MSDTSITEKRLDAEPRNSVESNLVQEATLDKKLQQLREYFREDDETEADASGNTAAAELFVREIELTIGFHFSADESARMVANLSKLAISGDISLPRIAAGDQIFRNQVERALIGNISLRTHSEMLTDILTLAARMLVKDAPEALWFDVRGALTTYVELSRTLSTHSEETEKLCHRLTREMITKAPFKTRSPAPDLGKLMALIDTFPNLEAPIQFLAEHFAMRRAGGKFDFEIPPVLLVGQPGIGKTYLAIELSRLIGTPYRVISAASLTSGFVLSGTDRKWGQAAPGLVFKAMLDAGNQVPVMVLDELDKAGDGYGSRNPLAPLHELLEPTTARVFVDEFIGFAMDVSAISWIATANEKHLIPAPILDRFTVFDVPPPSAAQLRTIVSGIYRDIAGPIPFLPREIPEALLRNLDNSSLREITRELRRVIGRVALAREMDPDSEMNLGVEIQPTKRRRMGF